MSSFMVTSYSLRLHLTATNFSEAINIRLERTKAEAPSVVHYLPNLVKFPSNPSLIWRQEREMSFRPILQ